MKTNLNRWIVWVVTPALCLVSGLLLFSGLAQQTQVQTEGEDLDASRFPSLQAAIDALPRVGGVIRLRPTVYAVASTITIRQRRCITIVGSGGNETQVRAPNIPEGSVLRWVGKPGGTLFLLEGVENLTLQRLSLDGNNESAGIGIDVQTLPGGVDSSSLLFSQMGISYFQTGIRLGIPGAPNNDTSVIEDVTFRSNGTGILFNSNQAVGWNIRDCHFISNKTAVKLSQGGGFLMLGCSFGLNATDIDLAYISDSVNIIGSTFEHVEGPIIKCSSPAGNPRMVVQIQGCRLDTNDPIAVDWTGQAHLIMQANRIKNGVVSLNNASDNPILEPVHTLIGNYFQAQERKAGIKLDFPPRARYVVFLLGNQTTDEEQAGTLPDFGICRVSSSGVVNLLDVKKGGMQLGMDLQMSQNAVVGVGGISASGVRSMNLRGSVNITGNSTSAKVQFGEPEPDANYFIALGVRASAGKPSVGALRASYSHPTKRGFVINVESPPGVGNSVTVDWHLIR